MRIIIVVFLAAAFSGCAFTPQAVVISPKVEIAASRIGADRALTLNVVDERTRQTLGTRGMVGVGAEITVQGSLQSIVERALLDGLVKQSFKPRVGGKPEARELRVEIRNLDYAVTQGFWANTLNVDVGLKAICVRGTHRPYEQLHRGALIESQQVTQGAEANNSYVNKAVSDAVNSLLKDQKLSACLSEP